MYKTKIDLSEKVRRNVIVILNDRLADAIDLQSQVKQAHWNVKGPHFISLHNLLKKITVLFLKKFNEMAEWGQISPDIKFSFSELKVVPNKQFIVKGTAKVARLRFGHQGP